MANFSNLSRCPNCWRFFERGSGCVAEERQKAKDYGRGVTSVKFSEVEKEGAYTITRDSGCVARKKTRGRFK